MAGLALKWLKEKGGVAGIEAINQEKSKLLYDCLAESKNFESKVDPDSRSIMNVPFVSGDPDLDAEFVKEATTHQLLNLKGHRLFGGCGQASTTPCRWKGFRPSVTLLRILTPSTNF